MLAAAALVPGCRDQVPATDIGSPKGPLMDPATENALWAAENNRPGLKFDKATQDLGVIEPASQQELVFDFQNTAQKPVTITKIEGCCGVAARTKKTTYAPGESGTIQVWYLAKSRPGLYLRRIYIHTDDEAAPKIRLTLRAEIANAIAAEPPSLLIKLDDEDPTAIRLTAADDRRFAVQRCVATDKAITAEIDPSVWALSHDIRLHADPNTLRADMPGYITFYLTHPTTKDITIPFRALSAYQVNPPVLTMHNVHPAEPITRDVYVSSNYRRTFDIAEVTSDNGHIQKIQQTPMQNGYRLTIRITPPPPEQQRKSFNDTLRIRISPDDEVALKCYAVLDAQTQ